jgi:hypothetical protein
MTTPIDQEEFGTVSRGRGRPPAAESMAARALPPLAGFKTPCRWDHDRPHGHCNGGNLLIRAVRRTNPEVRIATRCKDGTLYVFRYE